MNGCLKNLSLALTALALAGCGAGYVWRPTVPKALRSVAVPTFSNGSDVNELGAVATREMLREFQREGTFKLAPVGESALEIQGKIKSADAAITAYDRKYGFRKSAYDLTVAAEISVIDKRQHRVIIDNRTYKAMVTFTGGEDLMTAKRNASDRAANELARQVVDDVLNLKW